MRRPLAADTLTPESDRACRELAEYLKDTLNANYKAIAHTLAMPLNGETPVVVSYRDWNAWANPHNDFPLLCVYRRGSVGLSLCEATAIYYLPNLAALDATPGILRWVETRILRCLERYSEGWFAGSADLRHANVLSEPTFRSTYDFGIGANNNTFPFVAIDFNFEEIGV